MDNSPHAPVIVLLPAYMEASRIAATVMAARVLPGVDRVLVIDDGSTDDTAGQAECAGAEVIRLAENAGKGAALRAGLAACPGQPDDIILLLDADLGDTAGEAAQLLVPIVTDTADLAIARFPKATGKAGFGLVKGLARWGTWILTRQHLDAPISGQRACRRWVLDAAPIADGYGVEVAMNVAAGDAGARIVEVPVQMAHNASGRTLRGFLHRGQQYGHIITALTAAAFGRTGRPLLSRVSPWRALLWSLALLLVGVGVWRAGMGALPPLVITAVLGIFGAALLSGVARARRKNFTGRVIPVLGGLCLLPALAFTHRAIVPQLPLLSVYLLGWLLVGLLDDVKGTASRKGFRGHVSALCHGELTTGGVKLLIGGLLALLMAWGVVRPEGGMTLRAALLLPHTALLIALSANAMNLFDLRPGRALKAFWLAIAVIAGMCWLLAPPALTALDGIKWVVPFLFVTVLYAPLDFAGMMMLGDTGSNTLGALLGVLLAVMLPPPGQFVALFLLIALHVYAERVSITQTIARKSVLRWLDQLGRSE